MALLSVPLVFSPGGAPEVLPGIRARLEGAYVPHVDAVTATPTVCRPGKGSEDVNRLAVLPRPRIGLPLPFGLALQVSWVPPMNLKDYRIGGLTKAFGMLRMYEGIVVHIDGTFAPGSAASPALAGP